MILLMQTLQAQQSQAYPTYFNLTVLVLLGLGALGWLVATVLGFARGRGAGAAARWFALSAACMLLFHLHVLVIGVAGARRAGDAAVALTAFVPLFIVLAAACAVIGFTRLNHPPER